MDGSQVLIEADALTRYYKVRKPSQGKGRRWFVKRDYELVRALESVSFSIKHGSAVGLVGLNGAGKSTLLKLVMGLLAPTSGSIRVAGIEPNRKRKDIAKSIGVVFGHRSQLWPDVSIIESYEALRKIYSVDPKAFKERLDRLAALVNIESILSRHPREISLGQRMRAEILASLLHGPKLLILDEPTLGLDIVVKASIRQLIKSIVREQSCTVILASHTVADIEAICDKVLLIHKGKIRYEGKIEDIKTIAGSETSLEVETIRINESQQPVKETTLIPVTSPNIGELLSSISDSDNKGISQIKISERTLEDVLHKLLTDEDRQTEQAC